jgi:AcrR family transcriptional regulator
MLYAYFESKEGLFLACMRKGELQLEEAVRSKVLDAATPELRLWRGFRAVFEFFDEHPDLWSIAYEHGLPTGAPAEAAAQSQAAMARLLTDLFVDTAVGVGVDPQAARESEPLAHALTGATIGLLSWSAGRPDEPRDLHALRLMNFAWMGLGNLVEGELWVPPSEEAGR